MPTPISLEHLPDPIGIIAPDAAPTLEVRARVQTIRSRPIGICAGIRGIADVHIQAASVVERK